MTKFNELGLSAEFLKVLDGIGFKDATEIQALAIPLALKGKDVIGGAMTGSGKTLAFGASIIEHAVKGKGIQALILTPTRELAEQVSDSLSKFSRFKGLEVCAVYGGVGIEPQIRRLQYSDIVVGTPGRILDHLERRTLDLKHIKFLVLDEADRMLDMGFIEDVTDIVGRCPTERQTMLFSATISPDIEHIVKKYMKKPEYLSVEQYVDASKLKQIFYDVKHDMKFSLLLHLLMHEHPGLIMVFCNTQRNTDFVAMNLERYGIDAIAIHGGLSQARRTRVMEHFKSNKISVLVCTDVAARGLDIKNVSHVYNYDIPANSKEYIHRIGRTARAGKEGIAVSIVSQRDYDNFRSVLRNPDIKVENKEVPQIEMVFVKFNDRDDRRGGGRGGFSRGGRGGSYGGGRSSGRSSGGERRERRSEGGDDRRGRFEGRSERGSRYGSSSSGGRGRSSGFGRRSRY